MSISSAPDYGGSMLELTDHVPGKSNQVNAGRQRLPGLIIVLWRAGLRISEAPGGRDG